MKSCRSGTMVILFCLFASVFMAGCSSDCLPGEDKNITVSVLEDKDHSRDMGLTRRHNISINITNIRDTPAKNVEVTTGYCNDLLPEYRKCENRTFSIPYIPPNGLITQYFVYDRNAIENVAEGKYQLQYKTKSCLPFVVVNNQAIGSQR